MAEFCMPSLGADMEDITLVEWRVSPGDEVSRGQIIALVETDKSAVEVEVFHSGVVVELLIRAGTRVAVGTPLATINTGEAISAGEAVESRPKQKESEAARKEEVEPAPSIATSQTPRPAPPSSTKGRRRMSPAARSLARDLGVSEEGLKGSGQRGAVTRDDVLAAAEAAKSEPAHNMRRAIGAAMTRANREIPHYYLSSMIDLGPCTSWLSDHNSGRTPEQRLLVGALLLRAVALAVRKVPELNGHYVDGEFRASERVHVGMAVSLRKGGVIAPAIFDADQGSLAELMTRLQDVVARARAGTLRGSEITDATITITSLGDRGCDEVFGIINPPQVAMVGFGSTSIRPWVVDDAVLPRPVVTASLSADHRVSDGHRGGVFLSKLAKHLSQPEKL